MGEVSKTGGIHFRAPDGETGFVPFPQGEELTQFLDQVEDPILRDEFYRITQAGSVYNIIATGISSEEGEGLEISVGDLESGETENIFLAGFAGAGRGKYFTGYREGPDPNRSTKKWTSQRALCLWNGLGVGTNISAAFYVDSKTMSQIFGFLGGWGLMYIFRHCFNRTPPAPDQSPRQDPRNDLLRTPQPVSVKVEASQRNWFDLSAALLGTAALVAAGALIYVMGGAGLSLNPATGFTGTLSDPADNGA